MSHLRAFLGQIRQGARIRGWGGSTQFWQCQDFGNIWTPNPSRRPWFGSVICLVGCDGSICSGSLKKGWFSICSGFSIVQTFGFVPRTKLGPAWPRSAVQNRKPQYLKTTTMVHLNQSDRYRRYQQDISAFISFTLNLSNDQILRNVLHITVCPQ